MTDRDRTPSRWDRLRERLVRVQDPRDPDASMGLLRQVTDQALEPGYTRAAARSQPRRRWLSAIALVLVGVLLAITVQQTTASAPEAEAERDQVLERVTEAEAQVAQLRADIATEQDAIEAIRAEALGSEADLTATVAELEAGTGRTSVVGPGVVVVATDGQGGQGRVVDLDLQQLVNGLWSCQAEAVAVNGQRITSRSSIRIAGEAITVNYVSITPPYRVEAIGDPSMLPGCLRGSSAGAWWSFLEQSYGVGFDVTRANNLELPADDGLAVREGRRLR
ncbi:hypothetical protein CGZ92_08515 [Parenemella sanctibonifatiensis]|uniref:DUF881 domain-containing protein n=2 Tax=Parenemella sanctibonifatiensis TaxID=2016505 RepID=A0A255E4B9_9ACTN|nr:hypothetical protein CGZ92_08515 [Parenemella sanctibonifatiensis]